MKNQRTPQLPPPAGVFILPEQEDEFLAKFRKDVDDAMHNNPKIGSCWYEAMGRISKESKDFNDAVCAGKLWKGSHELYELAVITTALSMKMQVKPVLTLA